MWNSNPTRCQQQPPEEVVIAMKVKKPNNAFFLFKRAKKEEIQSKFGLFKSHELSKKAAELWREESEEGKAPFLLAAKEEFRLFKESNPTYIWPSRATSLKHGADVPVAQKRKIAVVEATREGVDDQVKKSRPLPPPLNDQQYLHLQQQQQRIFRNDDVPPPLAAAPLLQQKQQRIFRTVDTLSLASTPLAIPQRRNSYVPSSGINFNLQEPIDFQFSRNHNNTLAGLKFLPPPPPPPTQPITFNFNNFGSNSLLPTSIPNVNNTSFSNRNGMIMTNHSGSPPLSQPWIQQNQPQQLYPHNNTFLGVRPSPTISLASFSSSGQTCHHNYYNPNTLWPNSPLSPCANCSAIPSPCVSASSSPHITTRPHHQDVQGDDPFFILSQLVILDQLDERKKEINLHNRRSSEGSASSFGLLNVEEEVEDSEDEEEQEDEKVVRLEDYFF